MPDCSSDWRNCHHGCHQVVLRSAAHPQHIQAHQAVNLLPACTTNLPTTDIPQSSRYASAHLRVIAQRGTVPEAPPLLVTPRGSVAHVSLLVAVANFYTAQATGWYTRELRPPEETAMILGSVCGSFFPGIWDCFSHLPHAPLTVRGLRGQQTSNVRGACAR